MDKRKKEEVRRASVTPAGGGGGGWLDGPLWVGEARLRGSGNRVNLLSGRVGGEKKKN